MYNNFKFLKQKHNLSTTKFRFKTITLDELVKTFKEIPLESSPGCTKIPTKILKDSINHIGPILLDIFNKCLRTDTIPNKFKFAECIPLRFKL